MPGFPQAADYEQSPDSISLAFPPLPVSFQQTEFASGAFSGFEQMTEIQSTECLQAENSYFVLDEFRDMFADASQEVCTSLGTESVCVYIPDLLLIRASALAHTQTSRTVK